MRPITLALILFTCASCSAADARTIPAPARDLPATGGDQVAVLAGGCFWGVEAVFEHVRGVKSVVSGYAGGSAGDATYAKVSSQRTAHAEVVRIVYDPSKVSYGSLLQVFFAIAHDPTQFNRQGPDTGPSYRSAIFPQSTSQLGVARDYIGQLTRGRAFNRPVVTKLERGKFFPAERGHQNFMRRNPMHPYIVAHDAPKVRALKREMPTLYRS